MKCRVTEQSAASLLRGAVADVALMPKGHVLKGSNGVAAQLSGQTADRSLRIGLRLWGMAELPF